MNRRCVVCDVCLGTEFEPYMDPRRCGRQLERCRGCGLVMASRGEADAALRGADTRDPRGDARRAGAVMRILTSGRVLEVGCGEGYFLSALDPARYEVVGIDSSEELVAAAGRRIAQAGLRGGVLAGSLVGADLPAESFDVVALFGAIAGATSPRATCVEVARLLRSGGYAVIETPSLSSLTALLRGARWRALRDPNVDYFFTPASIERLASACGLPPGLSRLSMPARWPSLGNLVYVARKSSVTQRSASLSGLTANVGKIAPMGATH